MLNCFGQIKSLAKFAPLVVAALLIATYNGLSTFDLKTIYIKAYAISNNQTAAVTTKANSTALDYAIGKKDGAIAAVHDFSGLTGHNTFNATINKGSSQYRAAYVIGYNQEWKHLSAIASSTVRGLSSSASSLLPSYENIQHYLVKGTQSINYTALGQSLRCADLDMSSAHATVMAAALNCGTYSGTSSNREQMTTTPTNPSTYSLVTPTEPQSSSETNLCDTTNCTDNSNNPLDTTQSNSNTGNDNSNAIPAPPSLSPIPGIVPPHSG